MLGSVTEAFAIMGKHDHWPSGEQSITHISSVSRRRSARIFWNPCRFEKFATVIKHITPCCGVIGGVSGVTMLPPKAQRQK